MKIRECL